MENKIKIKRESDRSKVVSVKIIDNENKERELEIMRGESGQFGRSTDIVKMRFSYNDTCDVVFRFDFGDCIERTGGSPKLDADFYNKETNEKIKIIKKSKFYEKHHTEPTPNTRIYVFKTELGKFIFEIMEITATNGIACTVDLEYPKKN